MARGRYDFYTDADQVKDLVNPYSAEGLNTINEVSSPASSELDLEVSKYITADDDSFVSKRVKELGISKEAYYNKLKGSLPSGTKLENLVGSVPVKDIEKYAAKLKKEGSDFFDVGGPSLFPTALKWAGLLGNLAEANDYKEILSKKLGLDKLDKYGLNPLDGLTEGSFVVAALEAALRASSKIKVHRYLDKGKIMYGLFEILVKEVFTLCARFGSYIACRDIITAYGSYVDRERRYEAVILILQNFRLEDEDLSRGWQPAAQKVVEELDFIFPYWDQTYRARELVQNMAVFSVAAPEAIRLLQFSSPLTNMTDARLSSLTASAMIQRDQKYALGNAREVMERSIPLYRQT